MTARKPKPCQESGCERPKHSGKHRCYWHYLLASPIDKQIRVADLRLQQVKDLGNDYRARVSPADWPAGERWCAGCQWFVPMFYVSGSRCRACESRANHAGHLQREFGISIDDYNALFVFQSGKCYICQREPRTRRLAVDHNHMTGMVRGLLCSGERSCNQDVLGNIRDMAMARRIVEYLENPPWDRLHEPPSVYERVGGVTTPPWPF